MNDAIYTGDIVSEVRNTTREYTSDSQEVVFTDEQHGIWAALYAGIHHPQFLEHVCQEYIQGLQFLDLNPLSIPTVQHLNARITPRTGWRVERTTVRYTKADTWYQKFADRIFLITDYLRTRDQLEFTPEPDMFHDIFGHLPYLTLPFYAAIEDKFAPAYFKATTAERETIKSLAWYSTEFGLVMENNRVKVFGAGIISGRAEFANTVMEFYRLIREGVVDSRGNVYEQLCDHFHQNSDLIKQIISGIQRLHQQGEMSSAESGWNVIRKLYEQLGITRSGYLGGDVILAPFDLDLITATPKTVYAFNPIFYVAPSFDALDVMLDSYLKPLAARSEISN